MAGSWASSWARPGARSAVRAAPVAVLVVLAASLAWRERGSVAAGDWLGYSIAVILLLAAVVAFGGGSRPRALGVAGIALTLALATWAALSATWAPLPSLARDEGLLTATYAVALAIPLLVLRGRGDRIAALGFLVAGTAAVALGIALDLRSGSDAVDLYSRGRLYAPITYANGVAALFAVGFWPGIALAARRESAIVVRALALGAALLLLATTLAAQSKGALLGLSVSAIVVHALSAARLRLLVPSLLAAVGAALGFRTLTEPYRAEEADLAAAIHSVGDTILALGAAGLVAGLVYALVDRRLELAPRARRAASALAAAGLVIAVATVVIAFFARVEHPRGFFEDRWAEFKVLPERETTSTHLLALGSNRYDFWRVSMNEFRRTPFVGAGARAFGPVYLRDRRSNETPTRAHSLVFETLLEQGVVGFLLLAGAVGAPLLAAARRARVELAAAGTVAGSVYWLVHASVDWIWTIPPVALLFFCLLGIGAADDEPPALTRRVTIAAAAAAVALAALAFAPPWLSARYTARALASPASADADLRRARTLDPLSTEPLVAEAVLARSPRERIRPLEAAAAKQPESAALRYLLGVAYLDAGRRKDAVRELRAADRLHPDDRLVQAALKRAARP